MDIAKKKRIMDQFEDAARKVFAYKPPAKQRIENLPSHRGNAYPQDKIETLPVTEKRPTSTNRKTPPEPSPGGRILLYDDGVFSVAFFRQAPK